MSRPREFDFDTALNQAMRVFWHKGYEGTSLDDLCNATGLGRSSLYAAFGDKHQLLLRSLDRYEEQGLARIDAALSRDVTAREAIGSFIDDLIDKIVSGAGRDGCFVGNCAAELARHNEEATRRVRRSMGKVEARFRQTLLVAKQRKEIRNDLDIDATARFLVASIQGLRLVGKANQSRAFLDDIKLMILRSIE